ncbi:MAG: hypothetical protein SPG73_05785, partial [Sodaliphilus sp.]|nr:hypothetical protein [Sodaliphilus sp.]
LPCKIVFGRFDATSFQEIIISPGVFRRETARGFYPWGNVECFAFGGATVRFASLETSFHATNHTFPPPPSYEGYPHCPKDKNRSPFHGEKPLMIK